MLESFGKLEEQAAQRDETGKEQVSPDRLDALVWGLSEVMLEGSGDGDRCEWRSMEGG